MVIVPEKAAHGGCFSGNISIVCIRADCHTLIPGSCGKPAVYQTYQDFRLMFNQVCDKKQQLALQKFHYLNSHMKFSIRTCDLLVLE